MIQDGFGLATTRRGLLPVVESLSDVVPLSRFFRHSVGQKLMIGVSRVNYLILLIFRRRLPPVFYDGECRLGAVFFVITHELVEKHCLYAVEGSALW